MRGADHSQAGVLEVAGLLQRRGERVAVARAALVTSVVPLDLLYRVGLSDRYRGWERYCNERGRRIWKWVFWGMAVLIVAGAAAFFVAGVTSFARFTDQGSSLDDRLRSAVVSMGILASERSSTGQLSSAEREYGSARAFYDPL